jgi:hypothetical protein
MKLEGYGKIVEPVCEVQEESKIAVVDQPKKPNLFKKVR